MRETVLEIEKDNLTRVDRSYFDAMLAIVENVIDESVLRSVPVPYIPLIWNTSTGKCEMTLIGRMNVLQYAPWRLIRYVVGHLRYGISTLEYVE